MSKAVFYKRVFPISILIFVLLGIFGICRGGEIDFCHARLENLQKIMEDEDYTFSISLDPTIQQAQSQPVRNYCPGDVVPPIDFDKTLRKQQSPLPETFSWADYDALTPIKSLGPGCSTACWAFTMGGVIESQMKMHYGYNFDFSEQWIISCNIYDYDCRITGYKTFCFNFLANQPSLDGEVGIVPEYAFFYQDTDVVLCSLNAPFEKVGRLYAYSLVGEEGGYDAPEPMVEDLKRAIYTHGPIAVKLLTTDPKAGNNAFQLYSGGIFNYDLRSADYYYSGVLYGWDDKQGEHGVWFLRNSYFSSDWGEPVSFSWGLDPSFSSESGYMRIPYGASHVGFDAEYVDFDPNPQVPAYKETRIPNDYQSKGIGQNWRGDEEVWRYDLPFSFPFYEQAYDTVWIATNGYVAFSDETSLCDFSIDNLKNNKIIAPIWNDLSTEDDRLDIYIEEEADSVTIGWDAWQVSVPELPIQAELVLNDDGSFQFNYGGNHDKMRYDVDFNLHTFMANYFPDFLPVCGYSNGNGLDYFIANSTGRFNLQSDFLNVSNYAAPFAPGVEKERYVPSYVFTPLIASQGVRGVVSGDYSGDKKSDISFFKAEKGLWKIRGFSRFYLGGPGDTPVSADYNGDGTSDIALFSPTTGKWSIRGVTHTYFGQLGDIPVPEDYNGDGTDDLAFFRRKDALWKVKDLTRFYFGGQYDIPVSGDYTGAGYAQAAIFRDLPGVWRVRGGPKYYFGTYGDIPVPGDYTGDGSIVPGIYRPTQRLWNIRGVTRVYFGKEDDIPVPLDYSGVDALRMAFFKPSEGLWKVRGQTRIYFGSRGDTPATK